MQFGIGISIFSLRQSSIAEIYSAGRISLQNQSFIKDMNVTLIKNLTSIIDNGVRSISVQNYSFIKDYDSTNIDSANGLEDNSLTPITDITTKINVDATLIKDYN